jgi:DNA invertase Pin-like site-specific DNA recombinase
MASKPSSKPMDGVVRVSRVAERGGDDSYGSPAIQRDAMERWATYQEVELAKVFIDEDESGGTQDRPGLVAAIERALSGQTAGIVVYNVSRFSRFTEGGLRDLRRLEEAGARLVFVQEQLDTSTVHGKMIFTILLATHEAALEQIKAGWKVSKARGIREGRQIGPTPPGYRRSTVKNGRPKGSLVPHGVEGPAITAAYQAVAAARDLHAAIPILEQAIPEKTFTLRKAKGRRRGRNGATAEIDFEARYRVKVGELVTVPATWNLTTARRLLSSPVYIGHAFYNDGEIAANRAAHPPLIDGTTWRVVQRIIDVPDDAKRAPSGSYPLTGHAVCATCGGGMVGHTMGAPPRRGYRCLTSKRRNELRCALTAIVSADPLEAHVRALLVARAHNEEAQLEALMDKLPAGDVLEFDHEDLPATAEPEREALRVAEQALVDLEALRNSMPEAAFNAALEGQDAAVTRARDDLAVAEAEASSQPEPPEAEEIGQAPLERLPEFLRASGLVVRVAPGRGRLSERVSLEPREEATS